MKSPRFLLGLGLLLMLLGIILPFMMVIHVIESTFFLNFFSWGASVAGLALAMVLAPMRRERHGLGQVGSLSLILYCARSSSVKSRSKREHRY